MSDRACTLLGPAVYTTDHLTNVWAYCVANLSTQNSWVDKLLFILMQAENMRNTCHTRNMRHSRLVQCITNVWTILWIPIICLDICYKTHF